MRDARPCRPPTRPTAAACLLLLTAACGGDTGPSAIVPHPPWVRGLAFGHDDSALIAPAAATFRPGDTVHVEILAGDPDSLAWMGFTLSVDGDGFRDSVAVAPADQAVDTLVMDIYLHIPDAFSGKVDLTAFARGGDGELVEAPVANSPVSVWANVAAGAGIAALPGELVDVALDAPRGRAYLALKDRAEVAVLALATMTLEPPIPTPGFPLAVDLSASGDSLILGLPDVHGLGIVDLKAPVPAVEAVPLEYSTEEVPYLPMRLAVTARNEVFVVLAARFWSGKVGRLLIYDLQARRVRGAEAIGLPALIDNDAQVVRSADRRRVALTYGQMYETATDQVLAQQPDVGPASGPASLDRTGARTLIGASLFDETLRTVMRYHPPGVGLGSAISDDGSHAYFRVGGGFLRTRLSDGVTAQRFGLAETPDHLVTIPGTPERVLAFTATQAELVILPAVSGASASLGRTARAPSSITVVPAGSPRPARASP